MLVDAASLDHALQRAWPPRTLTPIGPWTARLDAGVTRRANSVLTHGDGADLDDATLDLLLAEAQKLYGRNNLTPWLQLTAAAWPPRLEERLDDRGWRTGIDPTLLLTGPIPGVAPTREVVLAPQPSEDWLTLWSTVDQRGAGRNLAIVAALLARLEDAIFASVVKAGNVVGVALGVVVDSTLVLECLATIPDARRCGVARSAVASLAQWASERDACRLLLAVQQRNVEARRLYDALGLEAVGRYAYARPPA